MPKRTDIESVLILGAGPIVIGQACEFDYSGAQACKALREEGYRVILVNSNPATIMTDPSMADATYIEPVHREVVARIIAREKPDVLLPTMGGQTALNCALDLVREGVLAEHGVELIGASQDAIDKAEDRERFDRAMKRIGLATPRSAIAHSIEEALQVQSQLGFPCVIRPSFTLGGSGGGVAYNRDEFIEICERGLELSPTNELLIDESLLGWKEFEMEVVRDRLDNCIIVCASILSRNVRSRDSCSSRASISRVPGAVTIMVRGNRLRPSARLVAQRISRSPGKPSSSTPGGRRTVIVASSSGSSAANTRRTVSGSFTLTLTVGTTLEGQSANLRTRPVARTAAPAATAARRPTGRARRCAFRRCTRSACCTAVSNRPGGGAGAA
jgi:hypothetical protein